MIPVPAFINIGWPEMLMILAIVLLFFGPKRLPEVADALGKSIRRFKEATNDAGREVRREVEDIKRQDEKKDNTKPQGPAQP